MPNMRTIQVREDDTLDAKLEALREVLHAEAQANLPTEAPEPAPLTAEQEAAIEAAKALGLNAAPKPPKKPTVGRITNGDIVIASINALCDLHGLEFVVEEETE